eukprot:4474730-Karenia_brevis.AAC.1
MSVEEFEKKSKKGQYSNNFERVAWWDNLVGSHSTKATGHNRFGGLGPPRAVRLGQCWKHSGRVTIPTI